MPNPRTTAFFSRMPYQKTDAMAENDPELFDWVDEITSQQDETVKGVIKETTPLPPIPEQRPVGRVDSTKVVDPIKKMSNEYFLKMNQIEKSSDELDAKYNIQTDPVKKAGLEVFTSELQESVFESVSELKEAYDKTAYRKFTDKENTYMIPTSIWTEAGTVQQMKDQFQTEIDPHYADLKRLDENPPERDKLFTSEKPLQGIMAAIAIIMGSVGDTMTPGNQNTGVVISNLLTDAIENEYKSKLNLLKGKKATKLSEISSLLKHQDKVIQVARLKMMEAANKTDNYLKQKAFIQAEKQLVMQQLTVKMNIIKFSAKKIIDERKRKQEDEARVRGLEIQKLVISTKEQKLEQNVVTLMVDGVGMFNSPKRAQEAGASLSTWHKAQAPLNRLTALMKEHGMNVIIPYHKSRTQMKAQVSELLNIYKSEPLANLGAAFTPIEDIKFIKDVLEKPSFDEALLGVFDTKLKEFRKNINKSRTVIEAEAQPLNINAARYVSKPRLRQYLKRGGVKIAEVKVWAMYGQYFGINGLEAMRKNRNMYKTEVTSERLLEQQ